MTMNEIRYRGPSGVFATRDDEDERADRLKAIEAKQKARAYYQRGSGLKVVLCHEGDLEARAIITRSQQDGVTLYKDPRGNIYAVVLEY